MVGPLLPFAGQGGSEAGTDGVQEWRSFHKSFVGLVGGVGVGHDAATHAQPHSRAGEFESADCNVEG